MGKLKSALMQVLVFSAVPFVVWSLGPRKVSKFWSYVGFIRDSPRNSKIVLLDLAIFYALSIISSKLNSVMFPHLTSSQKDFAGAGFRAIPSVFIFGLIHGIGFFRQTGFWGSLYVTGVTGSGGWILGHLMHVGAGGSIVPGWIWAHGLGNVLSSLYHLFFG